LRHGELHPPDRDADERPELEQPSLNTSLAVAAWMPDRLERTLEHSAGVVDANGLLGEKVRQVAAMTNRDPVTVGKNLPAGISYTSPWQKGVRNQGCCGG